MKLCRDCKHFKEDELSVEFAKCVRNSKDKLSLVTGEVNTDYQYCSTERTPYGLAAFLIGLCGKSGRFFQPKEGA